VRLNFLLYDILVIGSRIIEAVSCFLFPVSGKGPLTLILPFTENWKPKTVSNHPHPNPSPSQGKGIKTLIPEAGASTRKTGRIGDPAGYRDHSSYLADPAWKGPG
jgi:hypothetical protein